MSRDLVNNALKEEPVAAYVKLLRTAEALRNKVTSGLAPHNLTASQFSIMKVLRLRGPLAQRDIARYLLMASGNVTVVIDNLEKRELAKRTRDTQDRRIVFVELTDTGAELFDAIYPDHLDRIREVMSTLSKEGLGDFVGALHTLDPQVYEPLCLSDSEMEQLDSGLTPATPQKA